MLLIYEEEVRCFSRRMRAWFTFCLWVAFAVGTGCAPPPPPDDGNDNDPPLCETGSAIGTPTVSYSNDIRAIINTAGCLTAGCHGPVLPGSRFSMITYESSFQPGEEAEALGVCPIVPGDPEASFVIEKLSPNPGFGVRMPLNRDPLSDEQIELIATWIREGAPNN